MQKQMYNILKIQRNISFKESTPAASMFTSTALLINKYKYFHYIKMTVAFLEQCRWLCYPMFLLDRNSYYSKSLFFAHKKQVLVFFCRTLDLHLWITGENKTCLGL